MLLCPLMEEGAVGTIGNIGSMTGKDGVSAGGIELSGPTKSRYVEPRKEVSTPTRLAKFLCLDDFEISAQRKLPRQIFGYYAGAAETNQSREANRALFKQYAFVPRVLVNVSVRSQRKSLFGHVYDAPFGIAPMGLAGLSTFDGDVVLAQSGAFENIPAIASATSLAPLERIADEGQSRWFQSYLPGEDARIEAMVDRVESAGFEHFILTADVPVAANRENNVRAGFSIPLTPSLRLAWDGLTHPRWLLKTWFATYYKYGVPHFENMDAFRGPPILSRNVVRAIGARDQLAWRHVSLIRKRWKKKLIIKGILAPEDARLAREHGADGIIVSNHGGRQLDGAASALHVLSEIKHMTGDFTVMVDGGFRRGSDVLKALALGADFVFLGRPFMFAAAAAGLEGVRHAIQLLKAEIDRDMAMLGLHDVNEISGDFIKRI